MKASIALELIGHTADQQLALYRRITDHVMPGVGSALVGNMPRPAWVARITGRDARYGFAREFLRGKTDYAKANAAGTRGVYRHYIVDEGGLYEAQHRVSWNKSERFFFTVRDGDIVHITKDEVLRCLK